MRHLKILLVDDEESLLWFGRMFLVRRGYNVATASSGLEALDKIKKEDYDMVITNIRMPGMDGIQLLREINKLNKPLIKLILSGSIENEEIKQILIKEAFEVGCFAFIHKPCSLQLIKLAIEKAFKSHGLPKTILEGKNNHLIEREIKARKIVTKRRIRW